MLDSIGIKKCRISRNERQINICNTYIKGLISRIVLDQSLQINFLKDNLRETHKN